MHERPAGSARGAARGARGRGQPPSPARWQGVIVLLALSAGCATDVRGGRATKATDGLRPVVQTTATAGWSKEPREERPLTRALRLDAVNGQARGAGATRSSAARPGTGSISGIVRSSSGTVLAGATVAVEGQAVQTTTSADGRFVLKGIKPGSVFSNVSAPLASWTVAIVRRSSSDRTRPPPVSTSSCQAGLRPRRTYVGEASCTDCHASPVKNPTSRRTTASSRAAPSVWSARRCGRRWDGRSISTSRPWTLSTGRPWCRSTCVRTGLAPTR